MNKTLNHYFASVGNFIVRKSDDTIMGTDIYLGENDSIENYSEKPYTEDEYNAFCEKYCPKNDVPEMHKRHMKNDRERL